MSAGMSTELLSIEPKGQARATLLLINAIRLRIQQDVQEAFTRSVGCACRRAFVSPTFPVSPRRKLHESRKGSLRNLM